MTSTNSTTEPAARRRGRVAVAIQLAFIGTVLSFATIVGTTFFHADQATRANVTHLHYGFPISWITQDQSVFVQQPDLPERVTAGSPWHNPTDASEGRLLADVAIIGSTPAAVYLAFVAGATIVRRRRAASARARRLTLVA